MAEVYKDTNEEYNDLRKGKEFLCSKCGKGILKPYNASADKAHSFVCSNEKCNATLIFDPVIDIE